MKLASTTDKTPKYPTVEAILFHHLLLAQKLETIDKHNPSKINRVKGTIQTNSFEFSGNWIFEGRTFIKNKGVTIDVIPYLKNIQLEELNTDIFYSCNSIEEIIFLSSSILNHAQFIENYNPKKISYISIDINIGKIPPSISCQFRLPFTIETSGEKGLTFQATEIFSGTIKTLEEFFADPTNSSQQSP